MYNVIVQCVSKSEKKRLQAGKIKKERSITETLLNSNKNI